MAESEVPAQLATKQAELPEAINPEALELADPKRPGRPTSMTVEVVNKLIAAFHNAFTIQDACWYAGITKPTYYDWLKKDDRFSYLMSQAQGMPNRKAKEVVMGAIMEKDVSAAKWWLERKDPEFKNKTELSPGEGIAETRDKIKDFLDDDTIPVTASEPDAAGVEPAAAAEPATDNEVPATPPDIS